MRTVEIELRRKALVENPIIIELVTKSLSTKKLLSQLQKEYQDLVKIINYVKQIDRQTARALGIKPMYKNVKTQERKQLPAKLPANVILFRPDLKKKTAA